MQLTNFPQVGDNEKVSLNTSKYKVFDWQYALHIKNDKPDMWKMAGAILVEEYFDLLIEVAKRGGDPINAMEEKAIKCREQWASMHYCDYDLKGVVQQAKWLVSSSRGEGYMKEAMSTDIIGKSNNSESIVKSIWKGSIF